MAGDERYSFRPVALCCVLAVSGMLLLLLGLKLIMALRGVRMVLGLLLLFVAGVLFVGVYLLSRCAVIMDEQGVRTREIAGEWREIRWPDVVSVSQKHVTRSGRSGGYVMLIIQDRTGQTVEVISNVHTQALIRRYSPALIVG